MKCPNDFGTPIDSIVSFVLCTCVSGRHECLPRGSSHVRIDPHQAGGSPAVIHPHRQGTGISGFYGSPS